MTMKTSKLTPNEVRINDSVNENLWLFLSSLSHPLVVEISNSTERIQTRFIYAQQHTHTQCHFRPSWCKTSLCWKWHLSLLAISIHMWFVWTVIPSTSYYPRRLSVKGALRLFSNLKWQLIYFHSHITQLRLGANWACSFQNVETRLFLLKY